jgi:hypothetical protein
MFFERVSGYQSNPNASLYQTTKNAKIIIPVMLNTKDDDETIKGELTLKGNEIDNVDYVMSIIQELCLNSEVTLLVEKKECIESSWGQYIIGYEVYKKKNTIINTCTTSVPLESSVQHGRNDIEVGVEATTIPKTIWIYWEQGFENENHNTPEIVNFV